MLRAHALSASLPQSYISMGRCLALQQWSGSYHQRRLRDRSIQDIKASCYVRNRGMVESLRAMKSNRWE
ncbi:hypothetical protein GOODEAATRI_008716 [Goodea atripinnis]|uniref:Uncharacterized protein n=1 Tax=Goodea atripinnis TaxID=208336 RepID=A0ABV0NIJ9_9TELE